MKRDADMGAVTGHAFFGITDKNGKETVYGFHAATALPENANLTFKEKLPMLIGNKVQGVVLDDSKDAYDDKMIYSISQQQYDKIKAFAEKQKENPPNYGIFSSNCVIFAYAALRQADLKLPPQPLFHNPASAVLGIRAYEKAHKIKHKLGNAAAEVLARFSPTRKISRGILEELKKKPAKQAVGVKSLVTSLAGKATAALKARTSSFNGR
ncbi:MAG: hypothetical protein IJ752_06425 [Alphaproteobacteria bacterium]|nr:hypothetical protein [Alphaproteobacteria bacterium]